MPIWEYSCQACGHQFELLVRGTTTPACKACGSETLTRLVSIPAVKSSGTHEKALQAAKKRDQKLGAENARVQREYEEHHND